MKFFLFIHERKHLSNYLSFLNLKPLPYETFEGLQFEKGFKKNNETS